MSPMRGACGYGRRRIGLSAQWRPATRSSRVEIRVREDPAAMVPVDLADLVVLAGRLAALAVAPEAANAERTPVL